MKGTRSIFIDELPDRCGREIRRFFRVNGYGKIPLATKERSATNRRLWQVRFCNRKQANRLLKHGDGDQRFYLVERAFQETLPFEWED